MGKTFKSAIVALCLVLGSPALATDLPDPIDGVTFDEWASSAGRLAQGMPETEMLERLEISIDQWTALNDSFTEQMSADETFELIGHFGTVFADPTAGRFGDVAEQRAERKLITVEDWISFQQKMTYATKAGVDPQDVLAEAEMTIFDFTEENAYWTQHIRDLAEDQAKNPSDDEHPFLVLQDRMARLQNSYGRLYAKEYDVPYEGE